MSRAYSSAQRRATAQPVLWQPRQCSITADFGEKWRGPVGTKERQRPGTPTEAASRRAWGRTRALDTSDAGDE